jgi:uncharacterized YigZ family protein
MFRLVNASVVEEVIKRSRFVAKASVVSHTSDAQAFLERIRDARATHHCWAYSIGQRYRCSDDGEPGGTAGKPILSAIQRQSIDGIMLVVIRYYGGIKLGTGGLARAYGGCAAKCLQAAELAPIVAITPVKLRVAFKHIGAVYNVIDRFNARKTSETYSPDGLEIGLEIRQNDCRAFSAGVKDACGGSVELLIGTDVR